MKLTEITVERVREAYRKTGLKPFYGRPNVYDGRCCALGVLGYEQTGELSSSTDARIRSLKIDFDDGWNFVSGFDKGFQGYTRPRAHLRLRPWYDRGYEIGKAMREEFGG